MEVSSDRLKVGGLHLLSFSAFSGINELRGKSLVLVVLVDHRLAAAISELRIAHKLLYVLVLQNWLNWLRDKHIVCICLVKWYHVGWAINYRLSVNGLLEALWAIVGRMRAPRGEVLMVKFLFYWLTFVYVVLNWSWSVILVPVKFSEEDTLLLRVNWRSMRLVNYEIFFVNIVFRCIFFWQRSLLTLKLLRCLFICWHLGFGLKMSLLSHDKLITITDFDIIVRIFPFSSYGSSPVVIIVIERLNLNDFLVLLDIHDETVICGIHLLVTPKNSPERRIGVIKFLTRPDWSLVVSILHYF